MQQVVEIITHVWTASVIFPRVDTRKLTKIYENRDLGKMVFFLKL